LPRIFSEIHRVLAPGGHFRLSLPDYRSPILLARSQLDEKGALVHDAGGGGAFRFGRPTEGAHLWFPHYEDVAEIFADSPFTAFHFRQHYDESGSAVTTTLEHSLMPVLRSPELDGRLQGTGELLSMVIDAYKS
jgi:SAM-dependent methyltransferase